MESYTAREEQRDGGVLDVGKGVKKTFVVNHNSYIAVKYVVGMPCNSRQGTLWCPNMSNHLFMV